MKRKRGTEELATSVIENVTCSRPLPELIRVPGMGRCLRARKAYKPGDLIIREAGFITTSWDISRCMICNKAHAEGRRLCYKKLAKRWRQNVERIEAALADVQGIGEIDRARGLIWCLSLYEEDRTVLKPFFNLEMADRNGAERAAETVVKLLKRMNVDCSFIPSSTVMSIGRPIRFLTSRS